MSAEFTDNTAPELPTRAQRPGENLPTIEQLEKNIQALSKECENNDEALRKTIYTLVERADVLLNQIRSLQRTPAVEGGQEALEELFKRTFALLQRLHKLSPALPEYTTPQLAAIRERERATKEGEEFIRQYTYSPERFNSREAYMQFLADNLTSPQRINDFLRYFYRYSQEHDRGQRQELVNMEGFSDDRWLQPHEFATQYDAEGRITGDCEDIALLFQEILSRQGKQTFAFSVPDHALMGWLERSGNRVTASTVDTTGSPTRNAQAYCRQLEGNPDEPEQSVFSRLIMTFIGRSNARSDSDVNQINLSFLFPDGRAFNLPATFALAQRYRELHQLLRDSNYQGILKILNAELQANPTNMHLLTARLQFARLTGADAKTINEHVQNVISNINPQNSAGRMELMNVNQTSYLLANNGMVDTAIQLQRGALERWDRTRFRINEHDTLSDIYLQAGRHADCYANDAQIMRRILAISPTSPENASGEIRAITFFEFENRDMFLGWLRDRYTNRSNGYQQHIQNNVRSIDVDYQRYVIDRERLPLTR